MQKPAKRARRVFWPAQKKHKRKINRAMLRALDLPQETAPDVQKITMVGRNDLLVENHAGVMRYDDAVVRLRTHEGVLTVTGKELTLLEMANTRAYIQGAIASIGME